MESCDWIIYFNTRQVATDFCVLLKSIICMLYAIKLLVLIVIKTQSVLWHTVPCSSGYRWSSKRVSCQSEMLLKWGALSNNILEFKYIITSNINLMNHGTSIKQVVIRLNCISLKICNSFHLRRNRSWAFVAHLEDMLQGQGVHLEGQSLVWSLGKRIVLHWALSLGVLLRCF